LTEEIKLALVVLGVGMITVFVILGLVVLTGQLLIRIVNSYFPAAAIKSPLNDPSMIPAVVEDSKNSNATLAAIVAAVDLVTGGKGKAEKIERMRE